MKLVTADFCKNCIPHRTNEHVTEAIRVFRKECRLQELELFIHANAYALSKQQIAERLQEIAELKKQLKPEKDKQEPEPVPDGDQIETALPKSRGSIASSVTRPRNQPLVSVTHDSPPRRGLLDMSEVVRGSVDFTGSSPHRDLINKLKQEKKERQRK